MTTDHLLVGSGVSVDGASVTNVADFLQMYWSCVSLQCAVHH